MKIQMILMASGYGRRYGSNKLMVPYQGEPMYLRMLDKLACLRSHVNVCGIVVVTQYEEISAACTRLDIPWVYNHTASEGISSSVRLGIQNSSPDAGGYMFLVADQPELRAETIRQMAKHYDGGILMAAAAAQDGQIIPGNPVIFDSAYRDELLELRGDTGGKQVIRRHPEAVSLWICRERELKDIDYPEPAPGDGL